jgi:soluble lytic murein transglycosylase-like protein
MDRLRLLILAVCALLSTTIESDREAAHATPAALPSVSAGPSDSSSVVSHALGVDSATLPAGEKDRVLIDQILERLSIRHTALGERERLGLVKVIIQEARANNLEPSLVVAVIEVESAGYHLAVSHVGAMGLMQLLPSTGRELAMRLGIEWKGPDTLFDPIINVQLGTAYLRQLADQFGDVNIALAAYNWGPGRINRRIRRGATVPSLYIEQVMQAIDRNALASITRS